MRMRCDVFYRGSFDPPTLGHLGVLLAAVERFCPEKCIIVINDYTRKSKSYKAPAATREQMFREMLQGGGLSVEFEFHYVTDSSPLCYDDLRKSDEYGAGKKLLVMVTGVDTLSQWQDACLNKDKIALAWRHFKFPLNEGAENAESDATAAASPPAALDTFVAGLNARFPMEHQGFGEKVELLATDRTLERASSTLARQLLKENASTEGVLDDRVARLALASGYYS